MKRKLLIVFFLLICLVGINVAFIQNLRNLPYANYYILLLAINIDLLALIIITSVILRKLIKVYLGKHRNLLRRKLANILFLYLFVPLLLLNIASIFLVVHSTKTYLSSKTRALSSSAERVYRNLYSSELAKVDMYRNVIEVLLKKGLIEEVRNIEAVESIVMVPECDFEVSEGELSYVLCFDTGPISYRVTLSKDLKLIRDLSEFGELALDVRAFVKTRDIITGIFVFFIVFITMLTLLATVWLSMLVARHISEPVEKLSRKAMAIARGNLDIEIEEEKTGDEIEELYRAFIKMKENLKESYRRLKAERDFLERLLDALPVGVLFIGKERNIRVNETLKSMVGNINAPEELVKKIREDGNLRLLHIQGSDGELYIVEDISSIVLAERFKTWQEAVKRIAHEIKNPLTPIRLNLERLERYIHSNTIDREKFLQIIKVILGEIERISGLINQFKNLSPTRKLQVQEVSLHALLEDIKKLYLSADIDIEIKGDKTVMGDMALLKEVFYNLINNSLEWDAHKVTIEINQERLLYRDNGKGISRKEAELIFMPYYSGNPKGMGIGMAIVKKIVEEHGWTIKALPSEEGAQFLIEFRSRN